MGEWDVVKQKPIKTDPWNVIKVTDVQEEVSEKGRGMWRHLIPPRGTGAITLGSLGTVAGSPFGPPGMAAGAVTGATGGEAIEQILRRFLMGEKLTPQEASGRIRKEGALAGVSEMGTAGMGNLLRPFAKRMGPMAQKIATIAKQQKLPISPSAILPTKTARMFEWLGESILPGKIWGDIKRKQLSNSLMRMMDDIKGALPKRGDKYSVGIDLGEAIKSGKTELREQTSEAYGKVFGDLKKEFGSSPINGENLLAALDRNIEKVPRGSDAYDLFAEMQDHIARRGGLTANELERYQKRIWDTTFKKYSYIGGDIWEGVKKDLESEGALWRPLLEKAQEASKLEKTFNRNKTVKAISRMYALNPKEVIRVAFQEGNFDDILKIKKAVGKETWNLAVSRFVQNIFDAAITTKGPRKIFEPQKFITMYEKYGQQFRNVLSEDLADNLDNFYTIIKASIPELEKSGLDIGKASLQMITAGSVGAGSALVHPTLVVPAGFSFVLTKSLMNPKGWLKTWLTEGARGIMPEVIRQGPRFGGRALGLEFGQGE